MEARVSLPTAISQTLRCRSGTEFQTTAQGILRHRITGFQPVDPYGSDGDGGNDGYSRRQGLYAQIYAPTSQASSIKNAAQKALRDFRKILRTWNPVWKVKEYWF